MHKGQLPEDLDQISVDLDETEMTQFLEDGQLIQREINDGGAAAAEFASQDENYECSDNEKSESEDSDSDSQQDGSDYNVSQAEDEEGLISENDDVNDGRQKKD